MGKTEQSQLKNNASIDKEVRRILLKPMIRRRTKVSDDKKMAAALDRLDNRVLGESLLAEIPEIKSGLRRGKDPNNWKDPDAVKGKIAFALAAFVSRQISRAEYVFFAAFPVENIHEDRWFEGKYKELLPIERAMAAIREERGLRPDEDWRVGKGPKEHTELNIEYGTVLENRFLETLREFGLNDLANLRKEDPREFERLRERGRRSVFHREEIIPALKDIVIQYEKDAERSASAGAYSAAVTLLGAGVEGLLIIRCLCSPKKASRIVKALPSKFRPKFPDDPTSWNFKTLIETCLAANWLPPVSTSIAKYNPAGLADILRLMRNYVHPGRHVRKRPWLETDEDDYKDSRAIYLTLRKAVLSSRRRKAVMSDG